MTTTLRDASLEQQRLSALLALHGSSPVFHRGCSEWLHNEIDPARLRAAIVQVALRHDLLRTTFAEIDGRLVQQISDLPPIPHLVLQDVADPAAAALAACAAAGEEFHPRDTPPWRVHLLRTQAGPQLLLVVLHALLADEDHTAPQLLTELRTLTSGAEHMDLPGTTYATHVERQPDALRRARDNGDIAWWSEQISGAPPHLELASDRTRPPLRSFAAHHRRRPVERALQRELDALATALACDMSTVALAAASALLHRHTGQHEFAIGISLPRPADLPALGPVGEPVLLRLRAGAEDNLHTLVGRAHQALGDAASHGALAFMAAMEAERGTSPVFSVRFRSAPTTALLTDHNGYDLELGIEGSGEERNLTLACSADLFDPDTADRLLDHWQVLLTAALAAPELPVSALPMLTPDEQRTILTRWNPPPTDLGPDCRVHAQFEAQADRTPDAPAVAASNNDETLSYGALDRRASRLAARLRELGVGPDVPVGLFVERSLDLPVGVLGILKAGGAYVPLDPAHPPARLGWILEDTAVPVLVTQRALLGSLPPLAATIVLLDEFRDDTPHARVSAATGPHDLAYVIYTSGSTGRPKGIGLPHVALFNLIEWHARTLLGGAATLQFASLGFDASFHELFAAWRTGGVVHLIDESVRRDVVRLAEFIRARAIAKVILPVVVLQQLAQEYGDCPEQLACLREVTTTGEQMHLTAPVLALFRRLPGCTLHNHYGPSESHVVTALTLPPDPDLWAPHPPIGRPIDNCRLLVLDASMNLCPVGVPGELYIGGLCLARGYWKRPDLTAERFLADPHSDDPAARLYRSGDIARWRADGTIEYLGRRDDQVKIRGVRVEIGEVESSISRHPAVQETIVLAREDQPGERRLVAYVVLRGDASAAALAELRAFLRQSLPEVMIPAAFVPLPALPLTGNGKIDRRALPAPEQVATPRAVPLVAPRSEIEAALASIWRDVLRVDHLGVHDDFFELGGHSLAATQVFSRVRRIFGVELSFQRLFTLPTIAALATWIRSERAPAPNHETIARAPRDRPLPLSAAQERLWFLHRLAPDSAAYHCPYFFRLRGPLDLAALQCALDRLVRRHEVLRTTFHEHGGRPLQVIAPDGAISLEIVEFTADAPAAQLREHLDHAALRRFDLERGPLLRAGLVRLAADEHVLWLNIHHIILDGWSMDVLLRELAALYAAARDDVADDLPALTLQFADYAVWERARAADRDLSQAIAWWKARLAGAPALLSVPGDRPRPAVQSSRGGAVRFHLESGPGAALRALGVERGLTLAMVLLAGFVALLHRYTDEHDLVIGIPTAGRDREELEPLIGLFVNTLPIRVDLSGDPSFAELLDQVRRVCLEAYDHDQVPFDRLVQELCPQRDLGHNPLVQVGFAPQPAGERDLALAGLAVETLEIDAEKTVFDLALYTWEDTANISGLLEYSVDLFDRATIERMRDHLLALLASAAATPERKVSSLPLASAARSVAPAVVPDESSLERMHTLFERHAARAPEHPALLLGDLRMSHATLDRRATQLAHVLQARGVGPETLVALSVERSFDLIVGVLAILKAGAAFVPLDPDYPAERLAFMLADSAAPVVLTQSRLAARFAGHPDVIELDREWPQIARASEQAPECLATPDNAAYVIYTSGSTGRPKGVVVEHHNAVNLAHAQRSMYGLTSASVVLQFASLSFDAFVSELLAAWAVGAALCLLPPGLAVPGREFADLLRKHEVSLFALPPSLLAVLPVESFPALTHVVSGGEPCSAEIVERWGRGRTFLNVYGPTEATVCASFARCEPGAGIPPIGGPLANVRLHVLDAAGNQAPVGVPGELHIGGAGVARGYLHRPELTAERFIADPFADEPGARMVRTGDRVRRRGDGQLEYLGRLDQQIKLRGFRIELGEVEAALRAHPGVQDAAVIAGSDLIAFVVPAAATVASDVRSEHVDAWRSLNEQTYAAPTAADPALDFTGWTSSHTGQPIPENVMRVWRDCTVERLALLRPNRVWEIGCGTGLLLLPLAPRCAAYLGTDLSATAIARLRRASEAHGLEHVTLQPRAAHEPPEPGDPFDLVILNSVAQYFPDASYLRGVLAGATTRLGPGGLVFLGDLRGLPLLNAFHTSVQLAQAERDTPAVRLRERVERAIDEDKELVLDPAIFRAWASELPRLAHLEVWLKRGAESDEMTRFRHDVLLFLDAAPPPVTIHDTWLWGHVDGFPALARSLSAAGDRTVELLDVPNARVAVSVAAARRLAAFEGPVSTLITAADDEAAAAIDPEALHALGGELGYHVRITPAHSGDPAAMDVLFERGGDPARPHAWARAVPRIPAPSSVLANDPVRARLQRQLAPTLRSFVADKLPRYMVPSAIVLLDALPLLPNGKLDRRALAGRAVRATIRSASHTQPRGEVERTLVEIWREVLAVDRVGIDDPFFELGGHSLLLAQVRAAIATRLGRELPMLTLFQHATIRKLAAHLTAGEQPASAPAPAPVAAERPTSDAIAIVGMAGRFPGAADVEALWANLLAGVEGIRRLGRDELAAAGVAQALIDAPNFVPAFGVLDDAFAFDAAFFGYSPREALVMDPQQRVFLECAAAALEDAGHDPARASARIGVFGGSDAPHYWLQRAGACDGSQSVDEFQASLGNIADNLTARVSYKLGLTGPAVTVLSACSTSLVAVHMACQSLRAGECDAALAGGVAIAPPAQLGHLFEEGGILSADGHCRPFDAAAGGTVGANGVAIVVLRRLADALADGDTIHAVIRGSAIGNDGADKIGFTAPSARGQATTLARAHAAAGVDVESIGFIETHGTATRLGDPIEIAALREVFGARTERRNYCALGAIKSNLGHLGAAAGVTGLIKATLALARQQIPATLHFVAASPTLDLEHSPFFVNTRPIEWPVGREPRRAGVSAFGVGGTSAHVILEQSPTTAVSGPARPWQALCLSARDPRALAERSRQLAGHLREHPQLALADIAYTLHRRPSFGPERQVVVCNQSTAALTALESDGSSVIRGKLRANPPKLVFLFPGGGTQHAGMGRALYTDEPIFRAQLDACAERFTAALGEDIRGLLWPAAEHEQRAAERLRTPSLNMAAIFSIEYALAQLLIAWGLRPAAVIGHSLGEYAAALLAGILTLDDAIALVATRGRLCDESPPAAMVSVPLSPADASRWLAPGLSLAAINAADTCLVSGPQAAITTWIDDLRAAGIDARLVPYAGAAHSTLMDPLVPRLVERVQGVPLRAPQLPIVSCVTGTWLHDEARDPAHWGRHLRQTVHFADALATVLADPDHVVIEVGPGGHLAGLVRRHPAAGPDRLVVSAMQQPRSGRSEGEALLLAVAHLWCAGAPVDWPAYYAHEQRRRVRLPTYPFARTQYLLPAPTAARGLLPVAALLPVDPDRSADLAANHEPLAEPARTLAEIWSQLLGLSSVRETDNFYELGGSSLVAIQVRARVLERLGITIANHALIEYPTLGALARHLASHAAPERPAAGPTPVRESLLVRLKPGDASTQPLFLVQPLGGTVFTYLPLAHHLAWPGDIHGIRASGMEPGEPVLADIHAIARRYLDEISRIQPTGPVLLGGHSAGGIIAHEMAQQLLARGRGATLLMIDAPSVPALQASAVTDLDDLLRELTIFAAPRSTAYQSLVAALCDGSALGPIMLAISQAIRGYQPRPLRCDTVYIAAREQRDPRDTHAGSYWMDLAAGDYSLHRSPGDHFTMMETPHVQRLAALLAKHLEVPPRPLETPRRSAAGPRQS